MKLTGQGLLDAKKRDARRVGVSLFCKLFCLVLYKIPEPAVAALEILEFA